MSRSIHFTEFTAAILRCLPAIARTRIAVANSAGPDSTCLLFLLSQLFPPSSLLSVHVAHDLQPASASMAATAAANARLLAIPHRTIHVPWGVPPFPPAPTSGPLERIARDARYNLLFDAMTRARVSLIALGHHADDQLETAIMRLARGSSLGGAAGMRSSRRWGMGSPHHPLASFGHDGLNAFILRPLLSFPKDRIVATCRTHKLRYATDPTNFQPQLTARNAIRHCLRDDLAVSLPPSSPLSLETVTQATLFLQSIATDGTNKKKRLYSAVSNLATRVQRVDHQVTSHLTQSLLPSPTGTILLSSAKLLDVTDPDVRVALVLRVIRYVSFHPWGSLPADAHRRQTSVDRIVRALWDPHPQQSRITKFTAGAGVLWTPALFHPNRSLRVGNQSLHSALQPDDRFCWLASRAPPFSKNPQQHGAGSPARLVIDLTDPLRVAISSDRPLRVLYDCRFLLHIHPCQMPMHVRAALETRDKTSSIKILPFTQYYWPKVILQRESSPDQVLAVPQEDGTRDESWITIRWIRPLDAANAPFRDDVGSDGGETPASVSADSACSNTATTPNLNGMRTGISCNLHVLVQ